MAIPLASKRFSWEDQRSFAALSGDVNPMHMDAIAARRTSAGSPAVHGVHLLIWAIDELAKQLTERPIARIKADWSSFVHVGETAELLIESEKTDRLRARICLESQPVATLSLFFSAKIPAAPGHPTSNALLQSPTVPYDFAVSALSEQSGAVGFATPAGQADSRFPFAASILGSARIAGFLALSRLVGMVCPGLHSIFTGLDVKVVDEDARNCIWYKVTAINEQYRYLTQDVGGAGLSGTVESLVRNPPSHQPDVSELARSVQPHEFEGSTAIVIGGSRGLGEVAAKLLAAGGAHVTISYCLGRADADRVASSIRTVGASCEVIQYDARNSEDQLRGLPRAPTHVYYFATGPISQSRTKPFDRQRFEEFCAFYVDGFARLCSYLSATVEHPVRVFYPSSVYVSTEERPAGLAEYAMAKAAGEVLCGEINSSHRHIHILSRRLPRMLTDQTASLLSDQPIAPSREVMLAMIRALHSEATSIQIDPCSSHGRARPNNIHKS